MPLDTALIHRARLVQYERSGARNDQGEYPMVSETGPWFDARVMLAGRGGNPRQPAAAASATEAGRAAVTYEVLVAPTDENDDPVVIPPSGWLETDCPVLDDPVVVIAGQAEALNDGDELIGWLVMGDVVEDVP